MSDKLEAHRFFVERGIPSPRSWAPEDVPADARYPVLVKAREGFGSRNIHRASDPDELAFFLGYTDVASFVQEVCLGEEFSIDVFSDMEGRCLNAIPRTMLLSKGGESIKGVSLADRGDRARRSRRGRRWASRARERAVLPRAGRIAADLDVNTLRGGFPGLAAGGRYPSCARSRVASAPSRVSATSSRASR